MAVLILEALNILAEVRTDVPLHLRKRQLAFLHSTSP